jgi:hypothetical protein
MAPPKQSIQKNENLDQLGACDNMEIKKSVKAVQFARTWRRIHE